MKLDFGHYAWTAGAAVAAASLLAAPASAQDARDTLRIGIYSKAPTRGNPLSTASGTPSMYWWDGIFDNFTRVDTKGKVQPFAVESWELVGPTTWRVKFRKDIVFSNGNRSDAANIAAQFDYLTTDAKRASLYNTYVKNYASWKVVDEQTLDITTKSPDPILPGSFARFYVVDMKAWKEMGVEQYTAQPVTSGPWKVRSWTDNEALFVRHDKSWRPGRIANLRVIELPEASARRQALESGQIDLITNMSPDDVPVMREVGQAVVDNAPNIVSLALFTEDMSPDQKRWGGKPPFADKRVRLAANYAIDRASIARDLLGGVFEPANQPATPQTFGYNPDVPLYPYDPAKAKELLSQSSFPDGFSMIAEFIPGALANDKEIYALIADSLGRIGIKVDLRPIPFSDWVSKLQARKWDGEAVGFSYLVEPMMDAQMPFNWYSCSAPAVFVCIEEEMPLLKAARVEMDPVKREAILQKLMQQAHDDGLSIPVVNGRDIFGLSKRVKGFKNWNRALFYEEMHF